MRIGLLSDSHNNLPNLRAALEILRQAKISEIIHCGDLTELETALQLVEFKITYVYGNGDWMANQVHDALLSFNPENFSGPSFQGRIGNVKVAAVHGHQSSLLEEVITCGEFAYVFHGHSHLRRDVRIGQTRVINPGALGGLHREERSLAILDLDNDQLTYHLLKTAH